MDNTGDDHKKMSEAEILQKELEEILKHKWMLNRKRSDTTWATGRFGIGYKNLPMNSENTGKKRTPRSFPFFLPITRLPRSLLAPFAFK